MNWMSRTGLFAITVPGSSICLVSEASQGTVEEAHNVKLASRTMERQGSAIAAKSR
jgi:hypothetical protein